MKKIILALLVISATLFGKSSFNDPQPSFDEPRKWLVKLNNSDKDTVNHILGTIYNVLKEYPGQTLNVVVVTYGPGMRAIKKDYDKKTLSRIRSLMEYDVEFVGCINTMETMQWKEEDFIDDISYVQAGVVEVIERQVDGWIEATPY